MPFSFFLIKLFGNFDSLVKHHWNVQTLAGVWWYGASCAGPRPIKMLTHRFAQNIGCGHIDWWEKKWKCYSWEHNPSSPDRWGPSVANSIKHKQWLVWQKSLKENWQYDSFWKLWVGIVKFKFFCSVFLDHNWISNVSDWFMFGSVLFFALCRAHGYVLIETLCTCLHMSCFSNLVLWQRNVGTGEKAQNANSFLSKQLLLLFVLFQSPGFKIISSSYPVEDVIIMENGLHFQSSQMMKRADLENLAE